ncbi:MAG: adenylate/guanylate cyclase domain-containing protein [Myxococcota bacterium]|nr:adenylate/guanylate cyclase domain-containing protein [Myxococcota bacterium]
MAAKRFQSEVTRVFDAPRDLVWGIVSDTNRSDRALGLAAASYRWETQDDGKLVRVAKAKELGVELEWVEPPYEWIEGRYIRGQRDFRAGPALEGGFEAELEDHEGATRITARAYVDAGGAFALFLGPVQRRKFKVGLTRYLDAIEEVLEGWRDKGVDDPDEPAAIRVKRLLGDARSETATGARTPPDALQLKTRAARLRGAPVPEEVVERLVRHLDERPDEEVQQMRPFELARHWGLDRRDVLRGFLHATVSGLTDLRWQINCPVCRVGASVVESLDSLGEQTHCDACQIHFDTDFAQHVEAVFPSNPAVRPVETALYCASSPAFLPHVMAQLRVKPGETIERAVELPPGPLHARTLGTQGGADVELAGPPATLRVTLDDGITLSPEGEASDGITRWVVENARAGDATVLLERAGWAADAVLGTVVASFPEFVDLFATEAPASGVDLRVGHLALLFSDLVGSTALYERVGDARAFAIVEEHFRLMGGAVSAHGGAIVKTMGDAVMASFPSAADAAAAAVDMIARHDAAHPDGELGVKIGVHAGPCLAVRANERLDFFGTTVNMAARLQAQAAASEIVVTEDVADEPAVAALLEDVPRSGFTAALKGIESEQRLLRFDLRERATSARPRPSAGARRSRTSP